MISGASLRRKAWKLRRDLGLAPHELVSAGELLTALSSFTGVTMVVLPAEDPLLCGAQAVLNIELSTIFLSDEFDIPANQFNAAHEFAHWYLHRTDSNCSNLDLELELDSEISLSAASVVDGYSAKERAESEANTFASEILLPLPLAERLFLEEHKNAVAIAEALQIPKETARRQLTDAVLLPVPEEEIDAIVAVETFPLDLHQEAAARAQRGPELVSAGPGTGKTRTLVGRCLYLVRERNVPTSRILALTYSRRAAAELQERLLSVGVGSEGSSPWVGTFHAFGMELLRKYGERIGLSAEFLMIDQLDAATLLENDHSQFGLQELTTLFHPAHYFDGILREISRAKDELIEPSAYVELAEKQLAASVEAEGRLQARVGKVSKKDLDSVDSIRRNAIRSLEVSRVYSHYERLKRERNFVDFADLIAMSIKLLEDDNGVRTMIHRNYPHVLADEYQDVNRASARLLRLMAGPQAEGLWVVGDHRQSIYQFQGASPANVSQFLDDYPNGTLRELGVNYRSVPGIVQTFGSASSKMSFNKTLDVSSAWETSRNEGANGGSAVVIAELESPDDQAKYLAQQIEAAQSRGYRLSEVAVLCRTHNQARDLSSRLRTLGVPSLYQGPLLERPEVKALISILGAIAGSSNSALYEMARMPIYGLSEEDALNVVLSQTDLPSLPLPDDAERLIADLTWLRQSKFNPASMIRSYLFDRPENLEALLGSAETEFLRAQVKFSVRQFLSVIDDYDRRPVFPTNEEKVKDRTSRLLRYLNRLMFSRGLQPNQEFPVNVETDAVRISTVHSVKGLEFPVVFVPNLNTGEFPLTDRSDGVPSLVDGLGEEKASDEEECLFFVALSRARDLLFLSRSKTRNNGSPISPSSLLATLADAVNQGTARIDSKEDSEQCCDAGQHEDLPEYTLDATKTYEVSELELYLTCPRRFYFANVLGLGDTPLDDGYLKMSQVIQKYLDWLERLYAEAPPPNQRRMKLDELWAALGPVGHQHENLYRQHADMVVSADQPAPFAGIRKQTLTAELAHGTVKVHEVAVADGDEKVVVDVRKIGASDSDAAKDRKLALIRIAAQQTFPGRPVEIRLKFAADGSVMEVPASSRWEPGRITKYENAICGISAERYPPKPESPGSCRTCAFLLVCPRR